MGKGGLVKGILIIRKYKNRRLYDTERSCHVTREELMSIVRAGRDIQVQEAGTGEDVTVETLMQLILNDEDSATAVMSSDFLHFLARADGNVLTRFFRDFLPSAMQAFQASLANVQNKQQQFTNMMPFGGFPNPWMMPFMGQGMVGGSPTAPVEEQSEELKARIAQLEAELQAKGKKSRKK